MVTIGQCMPGTFVQDTRTHRFCPVLKSILVICPCFWHKWRRLQANSIPLGSRVQDSWCSQIVGGDSSSPSPHTAATIGSISAVLWQRVQGISSITVSKTQESLQDSWRSQVIGGARSSASPPTAATLAATAAMMVMAMMMAYNVGDLKHHGI